MKLSYRNWAAVASITHGGTASGGTVSGFTPDDLRSPNLGEEIWRTTRTATSSGNAYLMVDIGFAVPVGVIGLLGAVHRGSLLELGYELRSGGSGGAIVASASLTDQTPLAQPGLPAHSHIALEAEVTCDWVRINYRTDGGAQPFDVGCVWVGDLWTLPKDAGFTFAILDASQVSRSEAQIVYSNRFPKRRELILDANPLFETDAIGEYVYALEDRVDHLEARDWYAGEHKPVFVMPLPGNAFAKRLAFLGTQKLSPLEHVNGPRYSRALRYLEI